jgi:hypothetical protein
MTEAKPPDFYFDGIEFNPLYFKEESTGSGLTQQESDARYLIKTQADTATGLETFSGGIKTNSIDNVVSTDISNILINSTGNINIGTSTSRTTANPIIIGNANNTIVRIGTNGMQFSTAGTPTATLQSIATSNINVQTVGAGFNFLSNQTGALSIGTAINRTGDINIANTQTTGTANIVIGSTAITTGSQNITINRPLTIGYSVNPTTLTQIGGSIFINALSQPFGATGGSVTLAVLDNIPNGIYQVFYNISTIITVATATFTERITTISDRSADTALANVFNFMIDSDLLHQTRIVGHNFTITGGGIYVNTLGSDSIYLNQRYIYTIGPTVSATGHLRIVRIG